MPKGSWKEFDDPLATNGSDSNLESSFKSDREVLVKRTRAGKGGKTVTVIADLNVEKSQAKKLLKTLKRSCGSGGTIKEDIIELQGDQVKVVLEILRKQGYRPKQSGG